MMDDKQLVITFFKTKNIEARHFPKEVVGEKADFELYVENHLFGYCELKSIADFKIYGEHYSAAYNTIQAITHRAANQLKSVNPDHAKPNIVFFINHDHERGWKDLWFVLTGQEMPQTQATSPIDLGHLKRLLKQGDSEIIDYFIWADTFGKIISFSVNATSPFNAELRETVSSKAYEEISIDKSTSG
ncbi:MAG: hypothetical protein HQL08_14965 [Nitrospirae bacterium]|nr:hypothetical protein [Nitrospirota bacterium]